MWITTKTVENIYFLLFYLKKYLTNIDFIYIINKAIKKIIGGGV